MGIQSHSIALIHSEYVAQCLQEIATANMRFYFVVLWFSNPVFTIE